VSHAGRDGNGDALMQPTLPAGTGHISRGAAGGETDGNPANVRREGARARGRPIAPAAIAGKPSWRADRPLPQRRSPVSPSSLRTRGAGSSEHEGPRQMQWAGYHRLVPPLLGTRCRSSQ
jgi:hypothetical protein